MRKPRPHTGPIGKTALLVGNLAQWWSLGFEGHLGHLHR